MTYPIRLSSVRASPFYDPEACKLIDKVYVDNVSHGDCVAYDIEAGWANYKKADGAWTGKIKGTVRVTEK